METEKSAPNGPYVFQSGDHAKKSAELLMFQDYAFIDWYLKKLNSMMGGKMNNLHLHLTWLVRQGENRTAKTLCPQCAHDSPAKYFLALGSPIEGYTLSLQLTSCERQECRENIHCLKKRITDRVLPICFSSVLKFKSKTDQNQVTHLLRDAFQLPDRLTKEAAFNFFLK